MAEADAFGDGLALGFGEPIICPDIICPDMLEDEAFGEGEGDPMVSASAGAATKAARAAVRASAASFKGRTSKKDGVCLEYAPEPPPD